MGRVKRGLLSRMRCDAGVTTTETILASHKNKAPDDVVVETGARGQSDPAAVIEGGVSAWRSVSAWMLRGWMEWRGRDRSLRSGVDSRRVNVSLVV